MKNKSREKKRTTKEMTTRAKDRKGKKNKRQTGEHDREN